MNNKSKKSPNKSRKTNKSNITIDKLPAYSITYFGLKNWYKAMFEKLGWMLLAKAKGKTYKINSYKISIKELIKHAEQLMTEYKDYDKLHDIVIIRMNSMYLDHFVSKYF